MAKYVFIAFLQGWTTRLSHPRVHKTVRKSLTDATRSVDPMRQDKSRYRSDSHEIQRKSPHRFDFISHLRKSRRSTGSQGVDQEVYCAVDPDGDAVDDVNKAALAADSRSAVIASSQQPGSGVARSGSTLPSPLSSLNPKLLTFLEPRKSQLPYDLVIKLR